MLNKLLKNFYAKISSDLITQMQFDQLARNIKVGLLTVVVITFTLGLLSASVLSTEINPLSLWFVFLFTNFVALTINYFANLSIFVTFFKKCLQFYQRKNSKLPNLSNSLLQTAYKHRLIKPSLLIIMHCAWASYFLGAIISMIIYFLFTQAHFKLESTLLNFNEIVHSFSYIFSLLNVIPQFLGFPVIDSTVIAKTLELANLPNNASQMVQITHKTWALWLLGQIFVWGLSLRFALIILEYCKLAYRLNKITLPSSIKVEEVDRDLHKSINYQRTKKIKNGQGSWGIFFEIDTFMLPNSTFRPFYVNDKASRQDFLHNLAINPANNILIVVDASQTPDRGSLKIILQFMDYSLNCAIYLLQKTESKQHNRSHLWQAELAPLLLENEIIITQHSALLIWLNKHS